MDKPTTHKNKYLWNGRALRVPVLFVTVLFGAFAVMSQDALPSPTPRRVLEPAIHDLHGVVINMTLSEAKEKLGKPKVADKAGLYYEFSKTDTAQIGVDENKKVRTIALMFTSDSENIPTFAEIFGPDVPLVEKPNGSVYKMVRYPKAGYWVAYSRSAGDRPMTVITMRRINKSMH